MNIYIKLGASQLPDGDWGFNAECPYVHSDGSPGEGTREWALKRMGFIDTDKHQFKSYCEFSDKSAVVPFSVVFNEMNFFLNPVDGGNPGDFTIEYGSIGDDTKKVNCIFRPDQIEQAVLKALDCAESMYREVQPIATENPRKDDRFTLDEEIGWIFLGVPCDLININCVGKPRMLIPRVNGKVMLEMWRKKDEKIFDRVMGPYFSPKKAL
jgi:hypothetical protein